MDSLIKLLDGNKTYIVLLSLFGLLIYAGQQEEVSEHLRLAIEALLGGSILTLRMGVSKVEKALNGKKEGS